MGATRAKLEQMPTFKKRGDRWQARIQLAHLPTKTETFDTRAQAQAWAFPEEKAMREGKRGTVKATFQTAIDRYCKEVAPLHKSGDNESKRLKAIAKMLPTLRPIDQLVAADFSKFRDKRLTEVSVATVRKEMTIIRSVLESARRDWSMISINPIADVKRPPAPPDRKRVMLDDERDRILLALGFDDAGPVVTLSHQVAVLMLLALESAMRLGEMLALTWGRVDLKGCYVTLEETKNGDRRDVPLSRRAVDLLTKMKGVDKSTVFTVGSASVDALFRKARNKCKVENLHFHDTRATALTNLSKKLEVMELARMVGHRDLKSLMIYYRPTATTLAAKLG